MQQESNYFNINILSESKYDILLWHLKLSAQYATKNTKRSVHGLHKGLSNTISTCFTNPYNVEYSCVPVIMTYPGRESKFREKISLIL